MTFAESNSWQSRLDGEKLFKSPYPGVPFWGSEFILVKVIAVERLFGIDQIEDSRTIHVP